jgi:1-acyl-sn-glycerol-3-phosphate acyltransferase
MFGSDALNDRGGKASHSGWRISLNRFIWRGFIFTMGPLVVWVEKLLPNRGYGARIAAWAAGLLCRTVGVRLDVRGLDKLSPHQAYMFTPNHRSHFDNAALIAVLSGARFAAKKELFDEPALGKAMRALGMIPIDRADPLSAKRELDDAAARLGKKVSVVIFPEGTRAPEGQMLPFQGGAFVFAIQAGIPVVPVALHNTARVMPAHGYLSIVGGRVVVEILDPISTEGASLDDRKTLRDQAAKALTEALRPEDGGVARRTDLGSFRKRAFGVR